MDNEQFTMIICTIKCQQSQRNAAQTNITLIAALF